MIASRSFAAHQLIPSVCEPVPSAARSASVHPLSTASTMAYNVCRWTCRILSRDSPVARAEQPRWGSSHAMRASGRPLLSMRETARSRAVRTAAISHPSASTAGGIKIGTAAVLVFIVWTEIRGETAVNIGNRRLPRSIQRQALTLVLLAAMAIVAATFYLMLITKFGLDRILFEVLSAFATVGLTTGITTQLPAAALIVLMILMFIGRVGPMVVASALATRYSQKHFEYPKERPLIG